MKTSIQGIRVQIDLEKMRVHQFYRRRYSDDYGETWTPYPNCVFEDELEFVEFGRTNSSAYMVMQSTNTGVKYNIRWTDMKDVIKNGVLNRGRIRALFTFVFKWNYLGVALFDPTKIRNITVQPADWWNTINIGRPMIEM